MNEFSAEMDDKILDVVGDFWANFVEVMPSYGLGYLDQYAGMSVVR